MIALYHFHACSALPQLAKDAIASGKDRVLAAVSNRLVVVGGVIDHGRQLT